MRKAFNLMFIASIAMVLFACNGGSDKSGNNDEQTKDQVELKSKSPFDEAISGSTPVVVDFYADWCKPCQIQGPIIEELAAEMGDKIKVMKIDVDYEKDLANKYKIQSIPTIIIFKENAVVFQAVGIQSKEILKAAIENL